MCRDKPVFWQFHAPFVWVGKEALNKKNNEGLNKEMAVAQQDQMYPKWSLYGNKEQHLRNPSS